MRQDILLSIAQFEDLYEEWEDFKIKIVDDSSISVYNRDGSEKYEISEAKELLTDFKGVLKKNNMMIASMKKDTAKIEPYIYEFEADYEQLADSIERNLAAKITRLKIVTRNGKPVVSFEYATNLTSGEKQKVKKLIDELIEKNLNQ